MKLTDTLTLKERDEAAASILAGRLRGDVGTRLTPRISRILRGG